MNTRPCPKCGDQPNVYSVGDNKQFYVAKCSRCGYTPVKSHEAARTMLGAIRIWNKRCNNV